MKQIPFYDEYLKRVIRPRLDGVMFNSNEFSSLESLRRLFNTGHSVNVPEATFRQWFKDMGLKLTRSVRVVGPTPTPPDGFLVGEVEKFPPAPGHEAPAKVEYSSLPQGYTPLPSSVPTSSRGGIVFEGD